MPDYERPPVVEVVLGVQFNKLPRLKAAHLGGFWNRLGTSEWPTLEDAVLLPDQFEQFTEETRWGRGFEFLVSQSPAIRLQVKNQSHDRMIQVQSTRVHLNWLATEGSAYPRYENVRQGFESVVQTFIRFAHEEKLGDVVPNQWEITYVNRIPRGTVWQNPEDWEFFSLLRAPANIDTIARLEDFIGDWRFQLPAQQGRLHIRWRYVKQREGSNDFIRLGLTCRGPIAAQRTNLQAVLSGLDIGRSAIVRAFKQSMSDAANEYWGLKT